MEVSNIGGRCLALVTGIFFFMTGVLQGCRVSSTGDRCLAKMKGVLQWSLVSDSVDRCLSKVTGVLQW